jgi:hypothetical protein
VELADPLGDPVYVTPGHHRIDQPVAARPFDVVVVEAE